MIIDNQKKRKDRPMTEPTCDFCGASDKHRCRTEADADLCQAIMPMIDTLEPSDEEIDASAPDRLWLQAGGDYAAAKESGCVTWCEHQVNENDTEYVKAAYAIDARPVVKALEWDGHVLDGEVAAAEPYIGPRFAIVISDTREGYWARTGTGAGYFDGQPLYKTVEAAKQACQDHFASLITQCLEPAALVVSEEMVERAARAWENGITTELDLDHGWDDLVPEEQNRQRRYMQAALTAALTPTEGYGDFLADIETRIVARGELYASDEECLETLASIIRKRLTPEGGE